jgi:hypothetical protein
MKRRTSNPHPETIDYIHGGLPHVNSTSPAFAHEPVGRNGRLSMSHDASVSSMTPCIPLTTRNQAT